MNHHDLRKKFKQYFASKKYDFVPSASLIPQKDPSILFTNAGMNPFKDYFLGLKKPPSTQLFSIQKCLRAGGKHNDLEQVGYSLYHHTFFEMLGFFSFGSCNKEQAISYAMDFLTNHLGLLKKNLWVSVLKKDKTSADIWHKIQKFPLEKIFLLEPKDNFWQMGDTGPCGPCTEIYYYKGPKKNPTHHDMIEIWNLVFMELNKKASGEFTPLPITCIDTGMGLERLVAILQKQKNNYHTDLFKTIIESLSKASDIKYDFNSKIPNQNQIAFRVIADHCRAIAFLISDGILPGSDKAPYVLRRILRRALFYSHKLSSDKNLLTVATHTFISLMSDIYPALNKNKILIISTINKESTLFTHSLTLGKNILLQKMKTLTSPVINNNIVWDMYNTYGFPPDLTRLIAQEKHFTVELLSLEELKKQNNKKSIILNNKKKELSFKPFLPNIYKQCKTQNTEFTGYDNDKQTDKIICLLHVKNNELPFFNILKKNQEGYIIVNKTCFYPEGGGAIGDQGIIKTKTGEAQVINCHKEGNIIFHKVKILTGEITTLQSCTIMVNTTHRRLISSSHSATHLLHLALRTTLGSSVRQMGSLVKPGELRFDFNHPQSLTQNQLDIIETKIINYISSSSKVVTSYSSYKEATQKGALSLLGENYTQQKVRVIKIGDSQELCGGIHVKNSTHIGEFKIISESSVQSGVRRITAYTSDKLKKWNTLREAQNINLRKHLNLPIVKTPEDHNPFIYDLQKKEQQIIDLKQQIKTSLQKTKTPIDNKKSILKNIKIYKQNFLTQQNEELRKHLNISFLKEEQEPQDIFISFWQKKENQIQLLKKQLSQLTASIDFNKLIQNAKVFKYKNHTGYLLTLFIPLNDTKLLAEIADQLKFKIPESKGVVIVLGESQNNKNRYPLIITVTKQLTLDISASELFKNIVSPFLDGKGGGQARFAQGTIKNKELFSSLEKTLLKTLNKIS